MTSMTNQVERAAADLKNALAVDVHGAVDRLSDFADKFATDRGLLYDAVLLKREVTLAEGKPRPDLAARAAALVDRVATDYEQRWSTEEAAARRRALEHGRSEALKVSIPRAVVFEAHDLGKSYGRDAFSLQHVNLEICYGEITGVVGLNGNGKTTLFRLIVGEILPTSGTLSFPAIQGQGAKVRWGKVRQEIAYVPQELPKWYGSLRTNLHYEAAVHGILGRDNEREVDYIVERLQLGEELDKRWHELSGGFKLRFALARALVWKPKLLVLDEPLANLDFEAQQTVLKDIRHLTNSLRYPLAVLISSQHLDEIEEISDNMLFLDRGKVVYSGRTEDIGADRIKNRFELGGRVDLATLQSLLSGPEFLSVYYSGVSFVVVTTVEVTGPGLLRELLDAKIDIDYFRDNSRGVKSLFDVERPRS